MKSIKVYSSQFNYQYGSSIHFPYSIASLFAYAKTDDVIKDNFQFEKTFIFRNKLDEYIDSVENPDILLCSCYVWNWEITNVLARRVKEKCPNCTVIFGGPNVPLRYEGDVPLGWVENSTNNFFKDYPWVDILVHQEGEYTIKEIFEQYIGDKDYSKINGLETINHRTPPQPRITNLDEIPSPYLTDLIWDLVEPADGVDYISAWETNRGCPFQCTFCDWGSATKTKVRKWEMDRLFKEIEWFADNKIPYIDCCDANFGIFVERDLKLAKKLKSEKMKKGFPGRIRPAWAKIASEKIVPIAKELLDADLLRAVTLAVQSLDPNTLNIIKRKNIKFDKFGELVKMFRGEKIENYTEIIMGMPGETVETYKGGLEQLMELFPRPVVYVYNCGVFVNAPMNDSHYVKEYDIKTIRSPIYLWHSSIHNRGDIQETEDIVIGTNSFDLDGLKEMYLYGWVTQAFHSMGIFEYVSKFYNQTYDLKFMNFYETFVQYCKTNPDTIFGKEYQILLEYMDKGYSGGGWDHHDPELASILWPIEEATWLRCLRDSQKLESEMIKFIDFHESVSGLSTDKGVLYDLISFQVFLLMGMDRNEKVKSHKAQWDWKDYFGNDVKGVDKLRHYRDYYFYENKIQEDDIEQWCFQAAWIGRSQGNYKCHPEFLYERTQTIENDKDIVYEYIKEITAKMGISSGV
tara:strand:- start:3178 stop:5241 length:2064 start_codon:yes stop_codon:yes gene_type:complete